MTNEQLDIIAGAFGVLPFREESYRARANAQTNLDGRTHYVDDGTLKFFKARINRAGDIANGAYFFVLESLPIGGFDAPRKHRTTCFDMMGEIVIQTDGFANGKDAEKAFWNAFNKFDHVGHYVRKANTKADAMEKSVDKLRQLAKGV